MVTTATTGPESEPAPTVMHSTAVEETTTDAAGHQTTRTVRVVHLPGATVPDVLPKCPPGCRLCHPTVRCAIHGGSVAAASAIRVSTTETGSGPPLVQYACLPCAAVHNLKPEPDGPDASVAVFEGYRDTPPRITS